MAESTSTLQSKLKALTHGRVDIMADADTFKNTTQILREMADAWEYMTDIERAAALELMGGKRQANILSSLIKNFDTVEDVIATSMNSQGSAFAENAKWLDSIEGKTYNLKNAMQELWSETISADFVKGFLDLATGIVKATTEIGFFTTAMVALIGYFAVFKNITPAALFNDAILSVTQYSKAITDLNRLSQSAFSTQSITAYAKAVSGLSAEKQALALAGAGLNRQQIQEVLLKNQVDAATVQQILSERSLAAAKNFTTIATVGEEFAISAEEKAKLSATAQNWLKIHSEEQLTLALLKEAVQHGVITDAIAKEIAAKQGLSIANKQAASTGASLFASFKSIPTLGKIGIIISIASLVLSIGKQIADAIHKSDEDIKQAATEAIRNIQTVQQEFKTLKKSATDIIPRFAELAQGVDKFGKQVSLTDEEYEEFISLNNQIAELFPEINMGMDSNGNAMLALSLTASTLEESLWNLVEAQRAAANVKIAETMPDVLKGISVDEESINEEKELIQTKLDMYKDAQQQIEHMYSEEAKQSFKDQYGDKWETYWENSVYNMMSGLDYSIQTLFDALENPDAYRSVLEQFTIGDSIDWAGVINSKEMLNIISGLELELSNANDRIASKWKQLNSVVTAWVQTDFTYQGLSDKMQTVVQAMVGNLNFQSLGLKTEQEVQNYIQNNILSKIAELTPVAQQKFSQLMSIDASNLSTQEYIDEIEKISQELEEMNTGWSADEILKNTGYEDIIQQYKKTVDEVSKILGKGLDDNASDMEALKKSLYSLDPHELTKAFNIVKKYGLKTWDELEDALKNKTFDVVLDYDKEKEGMDKLIAAIEESLSATGLSAESIDNLTERYQELENFDPARLFEETTHGIRLNTKALRELEAAYQKQKQEALDNKLDGLTEQYNNLTFEIQNCSDAAERAKLYSDRQNVLNQINDTAELAAQYAGLTSAYYKWQQAQSVGNHRDMYEQILAGRKEMDEEMSRGWIDEGTRAYIELLSGKDLSAATYDEILDAYMKLSNAVNSSGYNVYDFFTQNEDGDATTDGIFNFLDAVKVAQEEVGKTWVKIGKDGSYIFDFGKAGDKAVADALGISEELVQIILRAAEDAGFEVNLDSAYSQLADFKDEIDTVNQKLKELGVTDYTFNVNSTDITNVLKQIEEAQRILANLKNEDGTLKIGVNEQDYTNAQMLLATLIYQKQTLDDSAILSVNVDLKTAETDIQTVIAKLIQFKQDYNELEVKMAIGDDTTEAEQQLNSTIESLNQEDKKILASLGIDTTKSYEEINTAITNITPTLMIECGLDTALIEGYQEAEHTTDGEVIWDNNIDKVTEWMSQTHETNGTVVWDDDITNVQTYFTASGTIQRSGGGTSANGTAHASGNAFAGGSWGAQKTETSLVGELGPEILVRNGRWTTVGENGAEFTQVKKGDIIFNHKQTEELLSNGYVAGRGKAYAEGTAFSGGSGPGRYTVVSAHIAGSGSDRLGKDSSSAANDFKETLDWIAIRLEEINEELDLLGAKLENAVGHIAKNNIIDQMLGVNNSKLKNLQSGLEKYTQHAAKLLGQIPAQYRDAAQDGSIAITEFAGDAGEKTVEAINNYREWAEKVADLTQQIEELGSEIADLAQQKFDNVADQFENQIDLIEAANDKLDAQISLMEDRGYVAAKEYYEAMSVNTKKTQEELVKERNTLQSVLDEQVKLGNIKVGSDAWYEMVQQLYDVDASIVECTSDLEDFQNAINDIYWDNFDELIKRYDYLSDETQNLIDLMDEADIVNKIDKEDGWSADEVTWTDEGITSLGLYAQQMEIAEVKSKEYAKAIEDLNKDYAAGKYSESEYLEKLDELKNGQYDSIEAYKDAKKAIKDLNKEMVDAVKDGIEKQIDAYDKLAAKRKEALDAEKDAVDFQKSISKQQKSISDIDRQLAALFGNTSISAMAKRKQLEAERAELQAELDDMYYDRSVENQKEAIDKELEMFTKAKENEIEQLDKYIEDVEKVVTDSLNLVQANASTVYDTLNNKANEYGLNVSEAVTSPWAAGENAISNYTKVFGDAASSTTDQLSKITLAWQEVIDKMAEAAEVEIEAQKAANDRYVTATSTSASTTSKPSSSTSSSSGTSTISTPSVGQTVKVKSSATHFSAQSGNAKMASFVPGGSYQVMQVGINGDKSQVLIGKNGQYTGWVKLTDLEGYAKGTVGVPENQLAWLDELGEELVMHADGNGRLSFLTKGTSVIPADLTKNLMQLGQLNPQDILDRSRPVVSAPHITNNNIELNLNVGEIVHVDTVTNETIPNLTKAIDKQLDKYMKQLNGQIRRYAK